MRKFAFLLALCIFFVSCGLFAQVPDLNKIRPDVQTAVNNMQNNLSLNDIYKTLPDVANCQAGVLNESEKTKVLNYINQIRAIHGLKPVAYEPAGDVQAQNASLICVANKALNHYPEPTAQCYSKDGYDGASTSNLYMSTSSGSSIFESESSITGWMIDDNSGIAADRCGHRRAIINPFVTKIAFGRSEGSDGGYTLTAMALKYGSYVDGSIADQPVEYVAYPQNNYPINLVNKDWFLTFSVIADKTFWGTNGSGKIDFSNATVEITDANNKSVTVHDIGFDYEGWGSMLNCLRWKMDGMADETKYTVNIKHVLVNGEEKSYTYWFKLTDNLSGVAPETPVLTTKSDTTATQPVKAVLAWKSAMYAQSYNIEIAADKEFKSIVEKSSNILQTSYQATKLDPRTVYYWHVKSVNDNGTSEWSETRYFKTSAPAPAKPQLASPANSAKDVILTPDLEWNEVANADKYTVEVSSTSDFGANIAYYLSNLTTNKCTIPSGKLVAATTYYWRVTASSSGGSSPVSDVWSFTTKAKAPAPVKPVLSLPEKNAKDVNPQAELSWAADPNADSYELLIADNQLFTAFSTIITENNLKTASYKVADGKLDENTTYYWKVRAVGSGGTSSWSDIWGFTTGKKVGVTDEESAFYDLAEYPNPAGNSITISFRLPDACTAQIKVFDMQGNEAGTYFNGALKAGNNNIELGLKGLNNGVYFYRIILTDKVLTGAFSIAR